MKSLPESLASELIAARTSGEPIVPPSAREGGLDLPTAYAVERLIQHSREAEGHVVAGRKAGYANRAMWRALKLDTLVWAHMYDDTLHYAAGGSGEHSLGTLPGPRIEPEIVFKFRQPPAPGLDAPALLATVEWLAIGFEVIGCPYPEWKFQPADFIAAWGLHRGLIIGPLCPVTIATIPELAEQLQNFKLRLYCNDGLAAEGAGKNSLRSPALSAAEFATATAMAGEPVGCGELFSSGTLTAAQPVSPGEIWRTEIEGLELANLSVRFC